MPTSTVPASRACWASPATLRPTPKAAPTSNGLPRLSKDAYRRESERIETNLERLNEQKAALEAALEDPAVQSNFVELRRLGSELAEIDGALSQAEDAWLTLEERAPA